MFSSLKLCVLLLAGCVGLAAARFKGPAADLTLMRFMAETRDAQMDSSDRTLNCFAEFAPIFENNLDVYEAEYKECLSQADSRRSIIDEKYQPDRNFIERAAYDACSSLYECKQINATKDAFDCYVGAGSGNTMVMYNISANASVASAEMDEQYRVILFDQYRCTNASENKYAQATADTYEELHLCLKGDRAAVVTTDSTSSSTSEPTVSSTSSPLPSSTLPPTSTASPPPATTTNEPTPPEADPQDSNPPARSVNVNMPESLANKVQYNIAKLISEMRSRHGN